MISMMRQIMTIETITGSAITMIAIRMMKNGSAVMNLMRFTSASISLLFILGTYEQFRLDPFCKEDQPR